MSDPAWTPRHASDRGATVQCNVVVAGVLRPDWGEWFAGFDVLPGVPRPGETTLAGVIVDQAELHGLLTRVRDLGLPLISAAVSSAQTECDAGPRIVRHGSGS